MPAGQGGKVVRKRALSLFVLCLPIIGLIFLDTFYDYYNFLQDQLHLQRRERRALEEISLPRRLLNKNRATRDKNNKNKFVEDDDDDDDQVSRGRASTTKSKLKGNNRRNTEGRGGIETTSTMGAENNNKRKMMMMAAAKTGNKRFEPYNPDEDPDRQLRIIYSQSDYDTLDDLNSKERLQHYFIHIPKSAGTSARMKLQEYSLAEPDGGWRHNFLCDMGTADVTTLRVPNKYLYWPQYYIGRKKARRGEPQIRKCTMYMTEGNRWAESVYIPEAKNVYTIVRNPYEHVVSQYFHCKESRPHKKKDLHLYMEDHTLDMWLKQWTEMSKTINEFSNIKPLDKKAATKKKQKQKESSSSATSWFSSLLETTKLDDDSNNENKEEEEEDSKIYQWRQMKRSVRKLENDTMCYNPIDLQSKRLDFKGNKEDLEKRFAFIGLTSEFKKSICAITIKWFNGTYIPPECDCTSAITISKQYDKSSSSNSQQQQQQRQRHRRLQSSQKQRNKQRTRRAMSSTKGSKQTTNTTNIVNGTIWENHGMVNSGSTHNTTIQQQYYIKQLTTNDQLLYTYAQEIFEEEISKLERQYSIKLCS